MSKHFWWLNALLPDLSKTEELEQTRTLKKERKKEMSKHFWLVQMDACIQNTEQETLSSPVCWKLKTNLN